MYLLPLDPVPVPQLLLPLPSHSHRSYCVLRLTVPDFTFLHNINCLIENISDVKYNYKADVLENANGFSQRCATYLELST